MTTIQDLRREALRNIELPEGRFFTPTPLFWSTLRATIETGVSFVDCGTGNGHLLRDAEQHGIQMRGVDLCRRPDQDSRVEFIDATTLSWSSTLWPLICRPSHDGWANDVVDRASAQGAHVVWLCKPNSYYGDLHYYGPRARRVPGVFGKEGERMYLIKPRKTK